MQWLLPTEREAQPEYFYLQVYKDGISKPCFKKYIPANINSIVLILSKGKYKVYIKPLIYYPKTKYGRANWIGFTIDEYIGQVSTADVEYIINTAQKKFENMSKYYPFKKAQVILKSWLDKQYIIKDTILNNWSISIKFKDGRKIIVSLVKQKGDVCGFEDYQDYWERYFGYDSEDLDNSFIDYYEEIKEIDKRTLELIFNYEELLPDYLHDLFRRPPNATTCPLSNRAIVLDSLHEITDNNDPFGEYERIGKFGQAILSLRNIGYDVDIKFYNEVNLETLAQIDEGGYGVILYCGHGGPNQVRQEDGTLRDEFVVTTGAFYNTLEEAENSPNNEYIGTFIARSEGKYCFVLTKDFVDRYMDDVTFPGTFIYWFSCSSGRDYVLDNMYDSLFRKGVTTGWLGFTHGNANVARHMWATSAFFRALEDPECTLAEAVVIGNETVYPFNPPMESSLRLLDEEKTGTNKLYIQLPDLIVEDIILDDQNKIITVIRNIGEGTITYPRHLIHLRVRIHGRGYVYDWYPVYESLGPNQEIRVETGVQIEENCEVRAYVDLHEMGESDEGNNRLIRNVEVQ